MADDDDKLGLKKASKEMQKELKKLYELDIGVAPGKLTATITPGAKGFGVSPAAMSPTEMTALSSNVNAQMPQAAMPEQAMGPDTSKDGQVYRRSRTGAWQVIYDSSSPTGYTTVYSDGRREPTVLGAGGAPMLPSDERLKEEVSDQRMKRILRVALHPYSR